ncbi:hypothetical protein F7984_11190 [Pradoshia sp. D12]|nr:hypothetical protein F7984_11190 [Pradoshia sp. D12]TPF73546.1 hypothetical protein FHY44_07590 [Bacillus sp. D12]
MIINKGISMRLHTREVTLNQLYAIYKYFEQDGDQVRAQKTIDIMNKVNDNEYSLAFCGHFSAGKSTLINYILKQPILPSSPIPTSANIVKIRSGNGEARVTLNDQKCLIFQPPIDFNKIKEFAKNGGSIQKIDLMIQNFPYAGNLVLLDTPGIDSTDEAHELSTASSFHLADAVFYVTDYNHIQSEINFQFTRDLARMGKRIYVIINQIDKHQEDELSFTSLKQSVKQAFKDWDIPVEEFFFTTMKAEDHPFNQAHRVTEKIAELAGIAPAYDVNSLLNHLITEHLNWKEADSNQARNHLEQKLHDKQNHHLLEIIDSAEKFSKSIINFREHEEDIFDEQIGLIIENSNITPYESRELAKSYLESKVTSFKVGRIFGKSKKEQEKETRKANLIQNIKQQTESTILWNLNEYFQRMMNDYPGQKQESQNIIQSFDYDIPYETIIEVDQLASVTSDLVLNFSKDLASSIKKAAGKQALTLFNTLVSQWEEEREQRLTQVKEELKSDHFILHIWQDWQVQLTNQRSYKDKIMNELTKRSRYTITEVMEYLQSQQIEGSIVEMDIKEVKDIEPEPKPELIAKKVETAQSIYTSEQVALKLQKASQALNHLPGLEKLAQELKNRADSLMNQTYTLALFGAFSAGKSSFANALLGANVLPVSPNPTTAVINRILPPTGIHKHGTATIHAKTETMLLDDLNELWYEDGLKVQDLAMARKQAQTMLKKQSYALGLKVSFLEAFLKGIDSFEENIGKSFAVSLEEFSVYATDETKSCFIERIDLYYDCDLTRKGVILVDTPGADSVNARHTGTSFNYIKHSDAICFITYYNHPFARADRNFLDQLGRVKDSFSMDKMFFLLNAADLAENLEERKVVEDYLRSELQTSGIHHPRIYPISSRAALQQRTEELNSGNEAYIELFSHFESAFYSFIQEELKGILVNAAMLDLDKALQLTSRLVELSNETEEQKTKRRVQLHENWERVLAILNEKRFTHEMARMKQETEELIHYSKQRINLNFPNYFKEFFNPGTLKDHRQSLLACTNRLLDQVRIELANEIQATSLRLEVMVKKTMHDTYVQLVQEIQTIHKDWSFSEPKSDLQNEYNTDRALLNLTADDFKEELRLFKGTQHFFEKNGRKPMADAFLEKLNDYLDVYYTDQQNKLFEHFESAIQYISLSLIEEMKTEGNERLKSMELTLNKKSNPQIYLEAEKQIKLILESEEENAVAAGKRV